jgi:large subunit ribosomal protein L17
MRHRKDTFKLGRTGEQRKALLACQVSSLINIGQIKTTLQKAKFTKRLAEKMLTYAKKGDLHHRRLAISRIGDRTAVSKLFSEIAPKYTERHGGYTRIIKLGPRRGDAAEMCILQWVDETIRPKKRSSRSKQKEESSAVAVAATVAEASPASPDEAKTQQDSPEKA